MNSKTYKQLFTLVLVFLGFLVLPLAARAEIGVSPASFDLKLEKHTSENRTVFVENRNPFPVQIIIETEVSNELLNISNTMFTLPPQTLQGVEFSINPKRGFSTTLNISARETAGENLLIQSGIRIPVEVAIAGSGSAWIWSAAGAFVLSSVLFFLKRRKKSP